MKTTSVFLNRLLALAIAAALALGGVSAAQAATSHTTAYGLISFMFTSNPIYDAIQLTTVPPSTHQNLIWVNYDVQYDLTGEHNWESATWISPAGQHYPASLLGTDWATDPMEGRTITLRNLTVDHTDLDAQNVQFRFHPVTGDSSLTLNDGSLVGLIPPGFVTTAHLTLTASGDSTIGDWRTGRVASQTTLNVNPGARLTFFRVGDVHGSLITDSMFFDRFGNTATIDGGTLRVQESIVTFGDPRVPPGETESQMTFKNNATLEVSGESAKLESNNFDFLNSSLRLGSANELKADDIVTLDGASVDIDIAGKIDSQGLLVKGNTTIALPKEYRARDYSVTTGIMVMDRDTLLTLNGKGSLAAFELRYDPAGGAGHQIGQIVINDDARLISTDGFFKIVPGAPITINRTSADVYGSMTATEGGAINLEGTYRVTNHGLIDAESDGWLGVFGPTTIQGGSEGYVSIGDAGVLTVGNPGAPDASTSRLTTDNTVELNNFSTLKLTLDPTALKNGQLRVGSTLYLAYYSGLDLSLVNDTVLPAGTKFILIDYAKWTGLYVPSQRYFNGYPDGSTFVLGLNHYRINYADSADPGYKAAITLTVVPAVPPTASLSPATQTLAGTVGANLTPSATLIPSGFGGTVTYTITPGLPAGVIFNYGTGVISGWPTTALAATTFTITGRGSSSGVAAATVTLTIASAGQVITFGPTPAPTYAPGGGFLVSASASSGLPVTYSSLTPAVCTPGSGNTVFMLSAGTCTIAADQAGNANYDPAPQVTQTISIARAQPVPLTLSAIPPNINVTETSALSTAGGGGTGLISFAVTGPCSIVGTTLTGDATGTCTVTATQAADPNYNAGQSNPVTIQVGPGAQTHLVLTASPTTLNINGTSALSTTGGSGGGLVTNAVNSGPCTMIGSSTVKATGAGQCQVVATKAGDINYGPATSNPVTLTVNRLAPPALVLSANPTSVGFGGSSTLSTSGGISGAPVTYSVTGPCSVSGNTLIGTSAGACAITASQAETSVYSAVTSNSVTVTVKARNTTFSYPQGTAIIGAPFALWPTTSGFTTPTFAVLYGNLPAGLTLDPATGGISGTPTGPAGTFDAVISAYEHNAYDAALAVIGVDKAVLVPTVAEWGLVMMVTLLLAVGGLALRCEKQNAHK